MRDCHHLNLARHGHRQYDRHNDTGISALGAYLSELFIRIHRLQFIKAIPRRIKISEIETCSARLHGREARVLQLQAAAACILHLRRSEAGTPQVGCTVAPAKQQHGIESRIFQLRQRPSSIPHLSHALARRLHVTGSKRCALQLRCIVPRCNQRCKHVEGIK